MSEILFQTQKFPIGELKIGVFEDQLVLCDWKYRRMRKSIDDRISKFFDADFKEENHTLIDKVIQQLKEYFSKERNEFDLPLLFAGSDFQKEVWHNLMQIPFGKTLSYEALSQQMKNPNAIRAVASANGANSISIIVPCHRIIGKNGDLVGYAGGLQAKKKLLQLENSIAHQTELFE